MGEKGHINYTRGTVAASTLLIVVIASPIVNDLIASPGLPHEERRGFIPFIIAARGYFLVSNPQTS